jgi:hypothetical protein
MLPRAFQVFQLCCTDRSFFHWQTVAEHIVGMNFMVCGFL